MANLSIGYPMFSGTDANLTIDYIQETSPNGDRIQHF
jgi:hypothetical protein